MVPNQVIMDGDQPVQNHSHAHQPLQPQTCVQEHCSSDIGTPFVSFTGRFEMSLVLLSNVLNYFTSVGYKSGRKTAVSISKGWI